MADETEVIYVRVEPLLYTTQLLLPLGVCFGTILCVAFSVIVAALHIVEHTIP